MKITYIGTAAAEAIPAVYCECDFCENARKSGGKELRRRSGALIDESLMIDYSADLNCGALQLGIRMSKVKNIIFTHSHEDHFAVKELEYRREPFFCVFKDKKPPLNIYGNKAIEDGVYTAFKDPLVYGLKFTFVPPYAPFEADGYTITPLSAEHCQPEDAYIYLIEKDGKRLLYAHDTGVFTDKTFEYLSGIKLDLISFDCTGGPHPLEVGHMGFPTNVKVRDILKENGCIKDSTVLVCNHFSHNCLRSDDGGYTYERFSKLIKPYGFIMSYDGLQIEI